MKRVYLEEICHIEKGKQIDTSELTSKGKYKYINGGISESGYYGKYNSIGETVLVSEGGASCGFVNFIDEEFWCGCHCYKLTESKVLPRYLYYVLKGNQEKIMSLRTGAAMPNIKKSIFSKLVLQIDQDEDEQRHVIGDLDNVQGIIDCKKKQLDRLDSLVKSQFVEMFGKITNTPFETKTIGDLCSFVKDGTHQTPRYTNDTLNGFKFLSSKDVTTGKINWDNIKYIPQDLHEKLYKAIKPEKNDILLAKNGTTGTAALVDTDDIFDVYVSLAVLRFKKEYNPKYMLYAINNEDTKKQFDNNLVGVGVPNLHLGRIKETKLIVPPIELQNKFASIVSLIDKSEFIVKQQIKALQELLDKKMDEYFK